MKIEIEQIIYKDIDKSVTGQAVFYKGEIFTYFDTGLTRFVFTNKDKTKVIKLLIHKDSKDYNLEEKQIYDNASEVVKNELAKTDLTYDGLIIEQEFCNPIKFDNRKMTMQQILFARSCRNEVGWAKDGRLVCFDLDEYRKY